jgi:adenylate cyclase
MKGKLVQLAQKLWPGRLDRATILISTLTCIVSVALYVRIYVRPPTAPSASLQFLGNIELKTLDARFQVRGKHQPGPEVVIVAIDQKSQDVLGRWPFPRSYFAEAVDYLRECHARVIAFDMNFPQVDANSGLQALRSVREEYDHLVDPSLRAPAFETRLKTREAAADNDQQFADALARYDNAILGYFPIPPNEAQSQNQKRLEAFLDLLSYQDYHLQPADAEYATNAEIPETQALSPNLPQFAFVAKNFGFFYVDPDPDGTVRRDPTVLLFQKSLYPSLDVAAVLAYKNYSLDQVKVILNPQGVEEIVLGPLTIPTDHRGFAQVDYDGESGTFPTYSLADVVQRKLPRETFRDRLVLIGVNATAIGDMVLTPFTGAPFPGVEVHANMIDDILHQHFIRRGWHEYLTDIAFIVLFSLAAGFFFSVLSPLRSTVLLACCLFIYFSMTNYLFAHYRMWVADFLPMATLSVTYAGITSYRFFFEEGEKRKVRSMFSQFLHPALVTQMLSSKEALRLGGEEKELTALFADIRGFTTLSEKLTPAELVELLNEYLDEMTEVIRKNWGTLDKYIGDAIMAFWGAPQSQSDQAMRACATGLEMLGSLKRLQASWKSRGLPSLDIGVGINSGPMLVGYMGSKIRKNYTIMGDSVNLASRLEGINRQFRTNLIISEATFLQVKDHVIARELDLIRVKGKTQPVKVYELLAVAERSDAYADLVARFEKGLRAYRGGDWLAALEIFQGLKADHPDDGPSQVFIERCLNLLAEPPAGEWDGVFVMRSK